MNTKDLVQEMPALAIYKGVSKDEEDGSPIKDLVIKNCGHK